MKRKIKVAGLVTALALLAWLVPPAIHDLRRLCPTRPDGVPQAQALPQWARRYDMSCAVCHTTIPRLSRAGYEFRRQGFRMPDEIGQEAKFGGLKDLYGVILRAQINATGAATDATAANSKVAPRNEFAEPSVSFQPLSGAFGKWWAARTELKFSPDEPAEIEAAYARATAVVKDWLLWSRAGVMHPYEGYGASDEPLGNFGPLFLSKSAKNGSFDTLVTLQEQNQLGAEFGAGYKDTTVSVAVLNGYNTLKGGANRADDNNLRDLRVFVNQMLGDKAAVSALYLNGKTSFQRDTTSDITDAGGANPAAWINNYQRLALFANYEVLGDKLNVLAGAALGKDHFPAVPAAATDNSDRFNSAGWFAELQSKLHEHFMGGLRYDTYRPSTRDAGNRSSAVTLTGALPFENVKFSADYRIQRTQSAVGKDRTDNIVLAEWLMAF